MYCADHTYCTLRCPVSSTAEHIKLSAADKLKLGPTEDLVLVEVRSSGERIVIPDNDLSVPTGLGGLNARLFVAPREHIDALVSGGDRRPGGTAERAPALVGIAES